MQIRGEVSRDYASGWFSARLRPTSTVQEIEAAIPRLTRAEVEALREWIEDYLEGHLDLSDEVKSKLDQSYREFDAKEGRIFPHYVGHRREIYKKH